MDGSGANVSLEDLEISQIEELESANIENLTTCSCRGNCLREKGRKYCPCKSNNHYCTTACHGDYSELCLNHRRAQESNSDDTTVSVFIYSTILVCLYVF